MLEETPEEIISQLQTALDSMYNANRELEIEKLGLTLKEQLTKMEVDALKEEKVLNQQRLTQLNQVTAELFTENHTLRNEVFTARFKVAQIEDYVNSLPTEEQLYTMLNREKERAEDFKKRLEAKEEKEICQGLTNLQMTTTEASGAENKEVKEVKEIEEAPMCEICLRAYGDTPTSTPRVLYCGHSLCEECARTISGRQMKLTCPFDRTVTELTPLGVVGLPKNFFVLQMINRN